MNLAPTRPNPRKVAAGREAARRRWGADYTPRVLHLDKLPAEYRNAVELLIRASRNAGASGDG